MAIASVYPCSLSSGTGRTWLHRVSEGGIVRGLTSMGGCAWNPERIFPLYLSSVAGYTEMGEGVSPDFIPEAFTLIIKSALLAPIPSQTGLSLTRTNCWLLNMCQTSVCCIKTGVGQSWCWSNRQKLGSVELRQLVSSHSDFCSFKIQAYKEAVNTHLATLDKQNSPNETWYRIQDILRSAAHTTAFFGEPRKLKKPITKEEVRKSINKLNNNRAPGKDGIQGELLKYGPETIDSYIANIINESFEKHEILDINAGEIIPLPKPGKPKGPPKNLRPITLLNTIRKTLSTIVLERIRPHVEKYISHSQSGFRPNRSTADVAWTHKWLAAKTLQEKINITITGIDMSAAFDTIDRATLLNILETIIEEDELRLVRFLLSNTCLNIRIGGTKEEKKFTSNIGTPQGDSLSPILFVVYLENALKEVRPILPESEKTLPNEIAYADDVDFIARERIDVAQIQRVLKRYNLEVNVDKTEYTILDRNEKSWKNTKKVGTLIGDTEDVQRRKQLSTAALAKLQNVWVRGDKLKKKAKLKLYRALVKSVLTYNCSTWALTQAEEKKLDAFHRKQLKRVVGIRYPVKITNKALYKQCNERPLSLYVLENRWRLFGHILRRDREIPANKAMEGFFIPQGDKYRGRPITTLPVVLNNDLSRLESNTYGLKTFKDIENLKKIAEQRDQWRILCTGIQKAAEALQTDDYDAERR
ncbi:hypothetical protein RRG08_025869 [Elysia crispata]|uniref:Reverse transcriptase domain-containing protein n=1 Tax=Elysia crispata TaxID=231223 RepID=A0AAE1DKY2_9GAST|nr:hypothetical protein RRG08_025869 [Elysia crispata]